VIHTLVAVVVLIAFAVAVSACTAYKARDADRNEGGGSMFRAAAPGVH
jgi:hypothetical protein